MTEATFLKPDDSRWAAFLERVDYDFYHLPGYLQLSEKVEGGQGCAFWAQNGSYEILFPLLIRALPENLGAPSDWMDALTPYGYPSPLFRAKNTAAAPGELSEAMSDLLSQFMVSCKERGLVSVFSRLHPLLDIPVDAMQAMQKAGEIVEHGETVYVDLRLPEDEIKAQIRRSHKKSVRRLRREGFEIVIGDLDYMNDFIKMYYLSMERLGAEEFYFFSEDYFRDLASLLGEGVQLFTVLSPWGEPACCSLMIECSGIIEGHLIGSSDKYLNKSPNKLLFDSVIWWGKGRGHKFLHLGGGVGGNSDSLFDFKAGMSNCRSTFRTWRLIVDSANYNELAGKAAQLSAGKTASPGFFPLYRFL